jgi:hypothetical protein
MQIIYGDDMKRKSISLEAGLLYLLIIFVILVLPAKLLSQNSTVRWSAFDMGFAMSVSSNTVVKSAIGQGFVGTIQQGNTRIESGFFADTSMRRTIISTVKEQWVPLTYLLSQNFPNPFNPSTSIEYVLPKGSFVSLKIYNVLGEEVATLVSEVKSPGIHKAEWRGDGCSSGVYFYRLQTGTFTETKKLVLLR